MQFDAAVLFEPGAPLSIERVEIGPLQSDDVLVKIHASGLCHSDLEVIRGTLGAPMPIVLGHEGAGIVEAVGPAVTQLKPGDHVICSWNPSCRQCFYCLRNLPILCEVYARAAREGQLMDGTTRLKVRGNTLHHQSLVSSHAEYCLVPESGAIPIPSEIPMDRACLIGCSVMTGVGAVLRVAVVPKGASVAVFGCGAVGLSVIQGARLAEAASIIAIDVMDSKLEMAQHCGATHTINASHANTVEQVRQMTNSRGADYTFEAAGSETTLQQSLEATRPGGQAVILGKVGMNSRVSLRFGSLIGEKRITRSSYGGARPSRDFPLLAQYYLDGKLDLDHMITQRIALREINAGFAAMQKGAGIRTVVVFPT